MTCFCFVLTSVSHGKACIPHWMLRGTLRILKASDPIRRILNLWVKCRVFLIFFIIIILFFPSDYFMGRHNASFVLCVHTVNASWKLSTESDEKCRCVGCAAAVSPHAAWRERTGIYSSSKHLCTMSSLTSIIWFKKTAIQERGKVICSRS